MWRYLTLAAGVVLLVGEAIGDQATNSDPKVDSIKPRDHVTLQLLGDLAAAYAKCTHMIPENRESFQMTISTTGVVVRKLKNGRFRVEHTSRAVTDGETTRLVTLTAEVTSDYFSVTKTPKGTTIWAAPGDPSKGVAPKVTTEDSKEITVHLAKLEGVKLRVWNLEKELGGSQN